MECWPNSDFCHREKTNISIRFHPHPAPDDEPHRQGCIFILISNLALLSSKLKKHLSILFDIDKKLLHMPEHKTTGLFFDNNFLHQPKLLVKTVKLNSNLKSWMNSLDLNFVIKSAIMVKSYHYLTGASCPPFDSSTSCSCPSLSCSSLPVLCTTWCLLIPAKRLCKRRTLSNDDIELMVRAEVFIIRLRLRIVLSSSPLDNNAFTLARCHGNLLLFVDLACLYNSNSHDSPYITFRLLLLI